MQQTAVFSRFPRTNHRECAVYEASSTSIYSDSDESSGFLTPLQKYEEQSRLQRLTLHLPLKHAAMSRLGAVVHLSKKHQAMGAAYTRLMHGWTFGEAKIKRHDSTVSHTIIRPALISRLPSNETEGFLSRCEPTCIQTYAAQSDSYPE